MRWRMRSARRCAIPPPPIRSIGRDSLCPGGGDMARLTSRFAWILAAGVLSDCTDQGPLAIAAGVQIVPDTATIMTGQTTQFVANTRDAAGKEFKAHVVIWTSKDPSIPTPSISGLTQAMPLRRHT